MKGFYARSLLFCLSLSKEGAEAAQSLCSGGGRRETSKEGKRNGQLAKVLGCQGWEFLFF